MAKIELTPQDEKELAKLMRNGYSKGEALVRMGKATPVYEVVTKPVKRTPANRKPREVDPVKDWLIGFLTTTLEGCVGNDAVKQDVTCVIRDGTKKIDLSINGESYSLTLTKHKKVGWFHTFLRYRLRPGPGRIGPFYRSASQQQFPNTKTNPVDNHPKSQK